MGADSVTRYRTLVLFLWAMALVLGAAWGESHLVV